ncbi:uncharacterized protein [Malus domestica]|uniref:uncharacterized protein n=1 Tax=Malus domestica TaxID=3750 RepID=UPI0039755B67
MAEAGRSLESLPKNLAAAIEAGLVLGLIVKRFFQLEKSAVFRWLLGFDGFKEQLLADDLFLTKVGIKCGIGIFTKTAAELERRRKCSGEYMNLKNMSNLNKLDFTALEVSRKNYLKWVQDVKLHLTAKNLRSAIEEETDNPVSKAEKATDMIFIRRHIHNALQTEYLAEEDPRALWVALNDHFDHQNDIFLPEFCNKTLTEEDLLENTHFIFSASNIVLKQQYRAQKFTKFSDLISVLLLPEKQNQLLMNNHQARPTGATVVPEAHYNTNQCPKRQKMRGRCGQKPSYQGQQSQDPSKRGNKAPKHPNLTSKAQNFKNKGKAPETMDADMCYRCGSKDHWSLVCRAPKKVVNEYHSHRKKFESNFMQVDELETTKMEISDFQEDTTPMED